MKDKSFDKHLKQKNMCPKIIVKRNFAKEISFDNYVKLFHKVIFSDGDPF